MTDSELLIECKKGLGQPLTPIAAIDNPIIQKLQVVKGFMLGAGVTAEQLDDHRSVGAIVCGVTDIWNLEGGNIKFSPLFYILLNQLR